MRTGIQPAIQVRGRLSLENAPDKAKTIEAGKRSQTTDRISLSRGPGGLIPAWANSSPRVGSCTSFTHDQVFYARSRGSLLGRLSGRLDGPRSYQRRILVLEGLGHTTAPPLDQGL